MRFALPLLISKVYVSKKPLGEIQLPQQLYQKQAASTIGRFLDMILQQITPLQMHRF